MSEVTIIGIDLAKRVFHLHGARVDGHGGGRSQARIAAPKLREVHQLLFARVGHERLQPDVRRSVRSLHPRGGLPRVRRLLRAAVRRQGLWHRPPGL